jgi:hypothetical protein
MKNRHALAAAADSAERFRDDLLGKLVSVAFVAGQSHEHYLDDRFAVLHRLSGVDWLLPATFPTLKRGANHHDASGAIEIGSSLVNGLDSCDWPWHLWSYL